MSEEKLVSLGAMINDSSSVAQSHIYNFVMQRRRNDEDTFCINFNNKTYYRTAFDLIDALVPHFDGMKHEVTMFSSTAGIVNDVNDRLAIRFRSDSMEWSITPYGDRERIQNIRKALGKDDTRTTLAWWYVDGRGEIECRNLELTFSQEARDEYYPYIKEGLAAYMERFRASSAPILILKGEPGGGKTSFIRHYIKSYSTNTVATYDDGVMKQDAFYINYLTDSNKALMVIEDADHLLADRSSQMNKTMSKLLNISDGLIKLENKKIIFTTNLTDFSDVDDAIIRPGRCFDVLDFRKLKFDEAKIAAKIAGQGEITEDREYSLSQIFNRQDKKIKNRMGFFG